MHIRRMSILGVGLLGGSLGLAVRSRISGCRVVGYGHRQSTLDAALQMGAIHEGYAELGRAVRGAEVVVLCTPVGMFAEMLSQIAPHLAPGAIVTDVGSTKRSIVAAAQSHLPPTVHFVAGHPMAGSEKRGVHHARAELFQGAVCILTPTSNTDPKAIEQVESLWQTVGMKTCRLSPEEHDRRLADISHLPHALAAALVNLQDEATLTLSGKGFLDLTRIAGGDAGLWRDILIDNRDNLQRSLARLSDEIDKLKALLDPKQAHALEAWLNQAAERRQEMNK